MYNYENPPWPLIMMIAWYRETNWSEAAKKEMEKRFSGGMNNKWLYTALQWYSEQYDNS